MAGRFAPTPSGPLHFGSLVAATASYCQARARGQDWLLRIEDVDTPRVVPGASEQILQALENFGFDWDGPVLYQSSQFEYYRENLERLLRQQDAYACECSRRSLRQRGVDRGPLGQIYPGLCRDKGLAPDGHSIRLNVAAAGCVAFVDRVYGEIALDLPRQVGDFVLRRVDGIYAYHLAVVVDDAMHNIDEVVRGADLLENTCLHQYLQRRLGLPTPAYLHVPLVNNADGVKLSKQTGATAVDSTRAGKLLCAALNHLGQQPPDDLATEDEGAILRWAVSNWNPDRIPRQRPAVAESLDQ